MGENYLVTYVYAFRRVLTNSTLKFIKFLLKVLSFNYFSLTSNLLMALVPKNIYGRMRSPPHHPPNKNKIRHVHQMVMVLEEKGEK